MLGVAAAILLAVGPVVAKMPYFSVEVSPPAPVEGDVVLVTVLMWEDAGHTKPATWSEPVISGLLEFRGDAGTVPITIHRLNDATYRAEVTLAAGNWQLVAFPLGVARTAVTDQGYPTPLRVTVSERWGLSADAMTAVAGALSILGLLLAGRVSRGMRHRRLRSATV